VEVRDVQAAAWHGNQWLIEEGLKPAERVIVEGIQRVMPGAPVKPVPITEAQAPAPGAPPAKGAPGK
jgi:membrane fusion protein (multidrug efflux system)